MLFLALVHSIAGAALLIHGEHLGIAAAQLVGAAIYLSINALVKE